ncbi:helix-turn-helix domain-containing protein [Kribbella sp. NPDC056345]|uniref:helix-turn-helix domain-containing protein n=1 Tax=Kribbella sp. NPDC056345 TaxID=3345789 RepID=UPI0035DBF858
MPETRATSSVLTPQEAADYLKVGCSTMKRWRLRGEGPRYAKVGKAVRYREVDLDEYVKGQLVS